MPHYTTYRSGVGRLPVFTGTVQLAGITFHGETAKNKKQAEKNAALAAWLSLKQLAQKDAGSSSEHENNEEQEQIRIARALQKYRMKQKIDSTKKFSVPTPPPPRPSTPQMSTSKILPLFTASGSRPSSIVKDPTSQPLPEVRSTTHLQRYFVQCRRPYHGIAPPVTIRSAVPVFSAPPPPPAARLQPSGVVAPAPVQMRQAIPVFSAPPTPETPSLSSAPATSEKFQGNSTCEEDVDESTAIKCLEQLEI